jgi:hypothetical protein
MEKAIVEAYLKTVQEHTRKYVEAVETESKAFAAALSAVKGIGLDPSLESRVRILEARATNEHRFHTTINGLSEDIGDLNERLIHLERVRSTTVDPWINPSTDEDRQFAFDSLQNEVVSGQTTVDLSPYIDGPVVVKKEYNVVEAAPVEEKKVEKKEVVVEKQEEQEEAVEEQEEEAVEEQEEGLNVEPFEYQGNTYYMDDELNVYKEDDEGNVNDTPVGRWLKKKGVIKWYPSA